MWFKNLALYRFTESFTLSPEDLNIQLQAHKFKACGGHDLISFGWTNPVPSDKKIEQWVHSLNGYSMICLKRQEKVIPAAVINDMLQTKIAEIEEQEARKLSRKERAGLKDDMIFDLLPRAFSISKQTYAYIDPKGGWIVVDSGSANKAEDLLSYLRKCLGSLPVVPVNTCQNPVSVMTQWLVDSRTIPHDLKIDNECELRSPEDDGGIIRCKRHNLSLPEITNHLDSGKQVIKIAVSWASRISFIIDESLSIKRLKFLDLIQDQVAETEGDDKSARFDVNFTIMTAELSNLLTRLLEIFGGENK